MRDVPFHFKSEVSDNNVPELHKVTLFDSDNIRIFKKDGDNPLSDERINSDTIVKILTKKCRTKVDLKNPPTSNMHRA